MGLDKLDRRDAFALALCVVRERSVAQRPDGRGEELLCDTLTESEYDLFRKNRREGVTDPDLSFCDVVREVADDNLVTNGQAASLTRRESGRGCDSRASTGLATTSGGGAATAARCVPATPASCALGRDDLVEGLVNVHRLSGACFKA